MDIKERFKEKKKELARVTKEYKELKVLFEREKYGGLTRQKWLCKKREDAAREKLKKLYDISKEYEIENRHNATESEKKFKAKLQFNNIKYEFQKSFIDKNDWYIADFYLPDYKILVEIDGGYHKENNQKVKDRRKTKFYKELGYKVLRLKNFQADKISADDMLKYIEKFVKNYKK